MAEARPSEEVIREAFRKADEALWWRLVSPSIEPSNATRWYVPSRTVAGDYYTVSLRPGPPGRPFWEALDCNCQAITSGKYVVCWHKAAVTRRLQKLREK